MYLFLICDIVSVNIRTNEKNTDRETLIEKNTELLINYQMISDVHESFMKKYKKLSSNHELLIEKYNNLINDKNK